MRIVISSDSTCDLPVQYLKEHNIPTMPLIVTLDTNSYQDNLDIFSDRIFAYVDEKGILPSTAARAPEEYGLFFDNILKDADAVIHISLCAEISSSFPNASLASKDRDNVHVIDSRNLSSGHGLVVMTAVELAESGKSVEEIIQGVNVVIPKVRTSFILNTLKYMYKGGRCTALQMIGATVLMLKPSISMTEGKMTSSKRYMGRLNECVAKYINDTLNAHPNCKKDKIFLTYSSTDLLNVARFEQILKDRGFDTIYQSMSGCTISSHCGPNCIGILFIDE